MTQDRRKIFLVIAFILTLCAIVSVGIFAPTSKRLVENAGQSTKTSPRLAGRMFETAVDSTEASAPFRLAVRNSEPELLVPNLVETIDLRSRKAPAARGLPTVLVDELDELISVANQGSSEAAFLLYRGLSTCRDNRYSSVTQLESALSEMRRTNSIVVSVRGQESRQYGWIG